MLSDLILGTAGHIDHGKTSLIAALTGTNTDRLPEEKKRGITIELGYAYLDLPPYRIAIVDVPGHEKFVRQMLAGATGIDLALLVIAANDSVKQQTREHLDILRILDLPAGVIAISKSDLVEPDWLELVEDEVRGLVQGTFLADAPIVPTSAKSGDGLDALKMALLEAAEIASQSNRRLRVKAPFKMAIDRTFTIDGHGTVVTGSISSGAVKAGESLEIQPGNRAVRVRSVENHDQSTDVVQRGQRAAINLSGIHHGEVRRGQELCAPGHLVDSKLVSVDLFHLHTMKKPLKDRQRVRFHVGTAELMGTIRLMDVAELSPGARCFAQIYLNEPIVSIWNQPFVIRRESPVFTIGGGRILDPNAEKIRKVTDLDLAMMKRLSSPEDLERAAASAYFHSSQSWDATALPRTAGVFDVAQTRQQLIESGQVIELKLSATKDLLMHRERFEQLSERIVKTLRQLHEQYPLRFKHPRIEVESQFAYLQSREVFQAALKHLRSTKQIETTDASIGLVGRGPKLSKGERHLLEHLTAQVLSAGLQPPTAKELMKTAPKNKDSVFELLRLATENGDLVAVTKELFVHQTVITDVQNRLRAELEGGDGLTMSEIRQILDTTRKFAIPICEYFDSIDFTRRNGDLRVLGSFQG